MGQFFDTRWVHLETSCNWLLQHQQGEPPIILENQAVVDKGVIFMNNVAAVQELAVRNEEMWTQVWTRNVKSV